MSQSLLELPTETETIAAAIRNQRSPYRQLGLRAPIAIAGEPAHAPVGRPAMELVQADYYLSAWHKSGVQAVMNHDLAPIFV